MDKPGEMLTLSQVLQKLIAKNGDHELKYEQESFADAQGNKYQPQDLMIIKTYRFEGDSNPDDSAILYIIEMPGGTTGYSMDAYGAYANQEMGYANFIRKIPMEDREEAAIFNL